MVGKGTKADCRLSLAAHHGIGVCTEHALALIVNTDEIEIFAALLKIVFYSVFSQAVDAQFVIYRSNGLYLLLRIKVSGRNPFNEFIAARPVGSVICIDKHICLFVAQDIATYGLAENLRVAIDIKIVVLQLEGQTYLLAKLIQIVGITL